MQSNLISHWLTNKVTIILWKQHSLSESISAFHSITPLSLFFNCHVIPESVRPVINCLLELHFLYSFITLAEMCSQCHVTVSRMWAQQSRLICSPALDPRRQPTLPDVPINKQGYIILKCGSRGQRTVEWGTDDIEPDVLCAIMGLWRLPLGFHVNCNPFFSSTQ